MTGCVFYDLSDDSARIFRREVARFRIDNENIGIFRKLLKEVIAFAKSKDCPITTKLNSCIQRAGKIICNN